uniref:1-phosphatidylinositol-4,5-bisphosphate phosphodiesterase gamma 1 n=1 Tax=Rattus norvegicus TaxID=10116 RepID=UPI00006CA338|nr:Chain A, 1-phosphatidylinositol-4,5-bisphosphate phosphodiesterase gamma 1 [Rattus norvegicus]
SIKNGILYLEDPVNHEWYPHYFVLTSSKIYYSEETSSDQGNEDEEEPKEASGSTELHSSLEVLFQGPNPAILEPEREHLDENSPLGDLLRGVLDVPACQIAIRPEGKNNRLFVFSISMPSVAQWSLDVAADSQEELQDWVKKIREVAQTA